MKHAFLLKEDAVANSHKIDCINCINKSYNIIDWPRSSSKQQNTIFRNNKKIKTVEDKQRIAELENKLLKRKAQLNEIEQTLPQKNSLYLKVRISTS